MSLLMLSSIQLAWGLGVQPLAASWAFERQGESWPIYVASLVNSLQPNVKDIASS